jgi:phage/plasmid-like protein (TIGR03299 family)
MTATADIETARYVDVNDAFAGEKANQITAAYERRAAYERSVAAYDSGQTQRELDAKLADDIASGRIAASGTTESGAQRYTFLTGWDRNETFLVQPARRPNEVALVLPEHGLDEVDGKVALYSKVPAWHGLGNIIPDGLTDVSEVLAAGGIDYDQFQQPTRYLWGKTLNPGAAYTARVDENGNVRFLDDDGEEVSQLRTQEASYVNVRGDNGNGLGTVGKIWRPIQASEVFGFLQELVAKFGVTWETAGAIAGGRRIFVSLRLPSTVTVDAEGINDQIVPFIVAVDDRTGNAKFRVVVTPWRPLCGNTERFAVRDAFTSWGTRHTTNAAERVEEARKTLGLSVNYFEAFAAEETALARSEILVDEFQALLSGLWPVDKPKPEQTARERNYIARRDDALNERFQDEVATVGRTAYAAERAVTGYLDNDIPRRGPVDQRSLTRAAAALEGSDDEIKSKAHAKLLTLVNGR